MRHGKKHHASRIQRISRSSHVPACAWRLARLPFVMRLHPICHSATLRRRKRPLPTTPNTLQRVAPRDLSSALAAFHVKPGFRIIPIATEPLVVDPVAISFDADGAMYVVEMRGYSEDADAQLGRIRKLVDRDDDGRFDTSWIYADNLSWPTAVTCWKGGILVAAAPDLLYLNDTDGDHRADVREVWFRGFGRSNVQGLVNSLQWGPDNRVHGATSSTGATLYRVKDDEIAGDPVAQLRGRDFAIEPTEKRITPTSGGGQHGMTFNRWGEKFVCQNSHHVQQILYSDHYLSRNPFAQPPAARIDIAADGPQADVFRTSPVEAWRIIRTDLRVSGTVPGPVERGGKAAGYFTGATGIRAFHGDRLPASFLDYLFVCDVGSNLVHRKRLSQQGIQYVAARVDEGSEFLTSDDIWFRPVQLSNGPEGCPVRDRHVPRSRRTSSIAATANQAALGPNERTQPWSEFGRSCRLTSVIAATQN